MNDAFGHPQSVVVLGGTSDIARSMMALLAHERCRSLVLAGRDVRSLEAVAASFRPSVAKVEAVPFDADNGSDAEKTVAAHHRCVTDHYAALEQAAATAAAQQAPDPAQLAAQRSWRAR